MPGGAPVHIAYSGPFLTGRKLIWPLALITSLFFLWGFSYGLLDVLNKHFQQVLGISKVQSTGLQIVYFGGGYFCFSPIAALVLKRRGYKFTIIMGLILYSLGAIGFWPTAHFSNRANSLKSLGGFIVCTFIIACGLATLETSANSYATIIGDPKTASLRLQFCQSWNGVASFIGPFIASKYFFSGSNANNLTNVQYVYLAVSCAGVAIGILFFFSKLPEPSKDDLNAPPDEEIAEAVNGVSDEDKPLRKQYNMMYGVLAQFCYVGSQVTIASLFINYVTENADISTSSASNMLSYALITFTVGRFAALVVVNFFQPDIILLVYALICVALNATVSSITGTGSAVVLIIVFFFEAPMYPIIFVLGTEKLGKNSRRGAGFLVQGVSGGAVFPPIQAAIADTYNTRISYLVPMCGFVIVASFALFHIIKDGCKILRAKKVDIITMPVGPVEVAVSEKPFDTITDQHEAIDNEYAKIEQDLSKKRASIMSKRLSSFDMEKDEPIVSSSAIEMRQQF